MLQKESFSPWDHGENDCLARRSQTLSSECAHRLARYAAFAEFTVLLWPGSCTLKHIRWHSRKSWRAISISLCTS